MGLESWLFWVLWHPLVRLLVGLGLVGYVLWECVAFLVSLPQRLSENNNQLGKLQSLTVSDAQEHPYT